MARAENLVALGCMPYLTLPLLCEPDPGQEALALQVPLVPVAFSEDPPLTRTRGLIARDHPQPSEQLAGLLSSIVQVRPELLPSPLVFASSRKSIDEFGNCSLGPDRR